MRVLIGFFLYIFVEIAVTVAVATAMGWLAVFAAFLVGLIGGLVTMQTAGTNAASSVREASRSGSLPAGDVGNSALLFLAGALIAIPGFVTDFLGLLLAFPPTRRLTQTLAGVVFGRAMRKRGLSVVTTTVDGTTVTRVVPGDVVVGDVIKREDQDPDEPPPQLPAR